MLLDMVSKVVSIVINTRIQRLIEVRGINYQFGATPKLGCQDDVFVLNTFLHERREKQLDTYVVFVALVKSYDSIQHDVIKVSLIIFGIPDDIITWIMKLYLNY